MRWIALLLLLASCATTEAAAEPPPALCNSPELTAMMLERDYAEKPAVRGLSGDGTLVIVFASEAGSWTLAKETPQGCILLVDAGQNWTDIKDRGPSY